MYRVHCLLPRADAERLSDLLSEMDPSPASAVSVEEASKISWSLDAFCTSEELAKEAAAIIEWEIPSARAAVQKLDDKDWVAVSTRRPARRTRRPVRGGWLARARPSRRRAASPSGSKPARPLAPDTTAPPRAACRLSRCELARKRPRRVLDIGTGSGVLRSGGGEARRPYALGTDMDKRVDPHRERERQEQQGRPQAEADARARNGPP
jgi:ribosomal protein L11 methyltransferase